MKLFFLSFFLWLPCLSLAMRTASEPQQVALTHIKRPASELLATISPSLSMKPLVHLNALLQQKDTFSCAYRSLFHAQCFELAAQRIHQGRAFNESLKDLLQDESLLNKTFYHVKNHLDLHYPNFDRTIGLTINQILGVCAAKIPLLHTKLLPILLEDDKKIYAVHDPTKLLPSPLYYSANFIRNYNSSTFPSHVCHVELDTSTQLKYQLTQLNAPHHVAHFACRFPNHIFIASIVTDKQGYAKLYVIDSNNTNIADHPSFFALTSKLLEYTQQHNTQRAHQSNKKQKPNPPTK